MIEALEKLGAKDEAAAWRILLGAADAAEFAVGLDYALERSLLQTDFAAQLAGEPAPAPRKCWINPIDGLEMVWIPGGAYLAGEPARRLNCDGFFLARHPVTNAQFSRFLDESGYEPHGERPDAELSTWNWPQPARTMDRHPAVWVSYLDALYYCRWAGLTLPNEWHWERAARGSDGRTYPWGEAEPRIEKLAHVRQPRTCPVGKRGGVRTPYGCEDLVGNVSEWCQPGEPDAAGFVWQACPDPDRLLAAGQGEMACVRGSAYLRRIVSRMSAAHRRRLSVTRRNAWVGFRPAFYPPRTRAPSE